MIWLTRMLSMARWNVEGEHSLIPMVLGRMQVSIFQGEGGLLNVFSMYFDLVKP